MPTDPASIPPVTELHHHRKRLIDVRPCPAQAEGPFINSDAKTVRCGDVEGHAGPHYWGVEWTHAH